MGRTKAERDYKEAKAAPIPEKELEEKALATYKDEDDYLDLLLTKHPRKARAVQLVLIGGHKTSEIASILGVNKSTVSKYFRDPEVKQYMKLYQKEEAMLLQAKMKAAATSALERMVDLMNSPIDGVALQAAKDLLDRAGHKPKQEIRKEIEIKTFEQKLTDLLSDDIMDVSYEEVDAESSEE